MKENCPEHDKCFSELKDSIEKLKDQLDEINDRLGSIDVRLAEGSGNFDLLKHRVSLLERLGFGVVALICTAVGMGLMGILMKYGGQ